MSKGNVETLSRVPMTCAQSAALGAAIAGNPVQGTDQYFGGRPRFVNSNPCASAAF
jgi:hypothetical protein